MKKSPWGIFAAFAISILIWGAIATWVYHILN